MPLNFVEFAHHYQGHGMNDAQQRAHFETFADLMECVVRAFWHDGAYANRLGISLDADTLSLADTVESKPSATLIFNEGASPDAAGKKDP